MVGQARLRSNRGESSRLKPPDAQGFCQMRPVHVGQFNPSVTVKVARSDWRQPAVGPANMRCLGNLALDPIQSQRCPQRHIGLNHHCRIRTPIQIEVNQPRLQVLKDVIGRKLYLDCPGGLPWPGKGNTQTRPLHRIP